MTKQIGKAEALAALKMYAAQHNKTAAYALMRRVGGARRLSDVPAGRYAAVVAAYAESPLSKMRAALRTYARRYGESACIELVRAVAGADRVAPDDSETIRRVTLAASSSNVTVFSTVRRVRSVRERIKKAI